MKAEIVYTGERCEVRDVGVWREMRMGGDVHSSEQRGRHRSRFFCHEGFYVPWLAGAGGAICDVVILGAGAGVMGHSLRVWEPSVRRIVEVEWDEEVVAVARRYFQAEDAVVRYEVGEACAWSETYAGRADVVMCDCYDSSVRPRRLPRCFLAGAFYERVAGWGARYVMVNYIGGIGDEMLGQIARAIRGSFAHVYVAPRFGGRESGEENIVVVGSVGAMPTGAMLESLIAKRMHHVPGSFQRVARVLRKYGF